MQAHGKKYYSFRADAHALGGYLEEPFEKNIPTLAPVSLPSVGGFAMARSEAFTLAEIITCSSAYTRVSGREHADGSISILVTAAVEGLNLLEVLTARRIVAQVSIWVPKGNGPPRFSLTGSRFEGLQVAGGGGYPKPNPDPQQPQSHEPGRSQALVWPDVQRIGLAQAGNPAQTSHKSHKWVTSDLTAGKEDDNFCCRVDGLDGSGPHILEIPGFGRITLGQLLLTPESVQLIAIRADLGCPVKGGFSICGAGGGGVHDT
jgi:hypothetical protein